jgi:flagellar hook-basal body complex protein FliE
MIANIKGIGTGTELGGALQGAGKTKGSSFGDLLQSAVKSVDASQQAADTQMEGLASGRNVDLHGTMIALEEANISLHAMTSVRDKLVDAYQTIWNMPI